MDEALDCTTNRRGWRCHGSTEPCGGAAGRPNRPRALAALAFIALAAVAYTWPCSFSATRIPFGRGDCLSSYVPNILRAFDPVSDDVAGAWTPTAFTGMAESDLPIGRYYPPTVLAYRALPPALAFNLLLVLHTILAALGTYVLLRDAGSRTLAALFGSVVFAFGGFMASYRPHVNMHQAACWLPWILFCFERFRRGGGAVWVVAAGTLIGVHALAAHLQMVLLGGVAWILYAAYFSVVRSAAPGNRDEAWSAGALAPVRRSFRSAVAVALASFLGAGVGLPQLLPFLDIAASSPYHDFDMDFYLSGSMTPRDLTNFVAPDLLGGRYGVTHPPGKVFSGPTKYLGVVPLFIALVGVAGVGRDGRRHGYWLLLGGVALALMLGRFTPLYPAMSVVPVWNLFHCPVRAFWLFGLAVAWFTAAGVDRLVSGEIASRQRLWFLGGALGLAAVVACIAVLSGERGWVATVPVGYPGFWVAGGMGILGFALFSGVLWGGRSRAVWIGLAFACTYADLWWHHGRFRFEPTPLAAIADPERFPEAIRYLRQRAGQDGPARALVLAAELPVLPGSAIGVPSGYPSVWGISALSFYAQSQSGALSELLSVDRAGNCDAAMALAKNRGISAAAGRFIVSPGRIAQCGGALLRELASLRMPGWREGKEWREAACDGVELPAGGRRKLAHRVTLTAPGNYVLSGEFHAAAGVPAGDTHIELCTSPNKLPFLDVCITPDEFRDGVALFSRAFRTGPELKPACWIRVATASQTPVSARALTLWEVTGATEPIAGDPLDCQDEASPYRLVRTFPDGLYLYENRRARPFVGFVPRLSLVPTDLEGARRALGDTGSDPRELAYVTATDPSQDARLPGVSPHGPLGDHEARPVGYRGDRISIRTRAASDGLLVLAVTKHRGWSAEVDAVPVPVRTVDGALMGLVVPAGSHDVEFRFFPVLVVAGQCCALGLLAVSWGALGAMFFWRRLRAGKPPRPEQAARRMHAPSPRERRTGLSVLQAIVRRTGLSVLPGVHGSARNRQRVKR